MSFVGGGGGGGGGGKIRSFYYNVAKKYKNTYSKWLMHKNIDDAIDGMFQIERTLLRREPTISQ